MLDSVKNVDKPQPIRRRCCGTMAYHFDQLEKTPGYRQTLGALEDISRRRMRDLKTFAATAITKTITIPVVVHILHRIAAENLSDEQVRSQIDVLNEDYGATNADRTAIPSVWAGLHADTGIRFALADNDPNGQPTSGIIRVSTKKKVFGSNNQMKFTTTGGSDAWPTDSYLNIWVCSLGEGLLGYAQFPGGSPDTDGVVILNSAFGRNGTAVAPFELGRTATHEVGHWLNLRHIWGDTDDCKGTDYVDDTPPQQYPNRQKPTFPKVSCDNGPDGDMFMNFMDYVDDAAMYMFTRGQALRMRTALETARPLFLATEVV